MLSLMISSRSLHNKNVILFVSTNLLNIDANWYDSRPTSLSSFSNLVCDMSVPRRYTYFQGFHMFSSQRGLRL